MSKYFLQSMQLKEIIERNEWQLYDITGVSSLDILALQKPAQNYATNHDYIFIRTPTEDQTAKDSFLENGYLGPSLQVPLADQQYIPSSGNFLLADNLVYLFTRLHFSPQAVIATAPPKVLLEKDPMITIIPNDRVIELFEKYFKIQKHEDLILSVPHLLS